MEHEKRRRINMMNLCDAEILWFNTTNWAQFFMIKALYGTLA